MTGSRLRPLPPVTARFSINLVENPLSELLLLREEIGSCFSCQDIASLGPVRDSYFGGVYELYLYHRRWVDGEVQLNHEHTDYAWVSRENYRAYEVMSGTDEDIRYFNIWPLKYLNQDRLPA